MINSLIVNQSIMDHLVPLLLRKNPQIFDGLNAGDIEILQ